MENFLFPVIKVKVIKVIKHFSLALFSYNIILNNFNIILYIYSVPPKPLMTLTLMTGEHQFLNVCLWYKYFTFAK